MCVCVLMHDKPLSFAVHKKRAKAESGNAEDEVDLLLIFMACCGRVCASTHA